MADPADRIVLPQTVRTREKNLAAPGVTDAVMLSGIVIVQFTGAATAVTAVVERSTKDPALGGPNWAPADSAALTGNPNTGMPPLAYREGGAAWWRARVTAITGSSVDVSIQGKGA